MKFDSMKSQHGFLGVNAQIVGFDGSKYISEMFQLFFKGSTATNQGPSPNDMRFSKL